MKKIIFLLCIISITSVQSQSIRVTSLDKEIIRHLFEGNWQKSDSLINIQLADNPDNLKYCFMKGYTSFYSRPLSANGLSRDKVMRYVNHYMWKAIQLGEEMPQTIETKFYVGAAYAFLSRSNIMNQDYWKAYWNANESENYFEDVLEENPNVFDAYLNPGITEYFADFAITGFRGFLAWLGGMSGDREKGLEYILKTANQGSLFADEAKYALALVYRVGENDFTSAFGYWQQLHDKYPNSQNISNSYLQAHLFEQINSGGVEFLENEIDSLTTKYNITNSFVLNTVGYSLIAQEKLQDALRVFKVNIKLYPTVANCYDSLAECYLNMGDNTNAIKYYKTAYNKLDADDSITEENREASRIRIKEALADLGADTKA